MHETNFHSTVIRSASYDEETRELTVRLTTGRTYVYRNVPELEYDRLVSADSAGRHYNLYIRDEYPFSEVLDREVSPIRPRPFVASTPPARRLDSLRAGRARRSLSRRTRRG